MARNILYALEEYDSGLSQRDSKAQALKNIRENSRQGTAGFTKARSSYQSHTKNLTPAGKTVFNRIRAYTEKQETGMGSLSGGNPGLREPVYAAFRSLLENPAYFSKVWFDAYSFTRSLMTNPFDPGLFSPLKGKIRYLKEKNHDR
jgi:hypothetical protein